MVNNIKEFCKLYKVHIPYEPEFNYYVGTLMKSKEYKDLFDRIAEFRDLEKDGKSVKEYKFKKIDEMVAFIESSKAYNWLMSHDLNHKFEHKNIDWDKAPKKVVSFNIKQANFTALKYADADNELGNTWEEFCAKFDLHPALVNSKAFRQFVFGNTNPKRLQKVQQSFTLKLKELLLEGLLDGDESKILFVSCDEIIIEEVPGIYQVSDKFRITHYEVTPLGGGMLLKSFPNKMKQLHSVPSNKYFKMFKKHVLGESVEEKDLYFTVDGELARWVI
jgi:hypothetical protein